MRSRSRRRFARSVAGTRPAAAGATSVSVVMAWAAVSRGQRFDSAFSSSIFLSTPFRPVPRSLTLPASKSYPKFWKSSWYLPPFALAGVLTLFGLAAMVKKVRKLGSLSRSGDLSASMVLGTLWILLENVTSALVSVVRYFTRSHAAFGDLVVFGMPMIVPLRYPEPYRSALSSATGIGAVP